MPRIFSCSCVPLSCLVMRYRPNASSTYEIDPNFGWSPSFSTELSQVQIGYELVSRLWLLRIFWLIVSFDFQLKPSVNHKTYQVTLSPFLENQIKVQSELDHGSAIKFSSDASRWLAIYFNVNIVRHREEMLERKCSSQKHFPGRIPGFFSLV